MRFFLLVFHLLLTLVMIGVILMQRGEDASAGSGSGGGMPGGRSGKNFLTRATAILASVFFANCIVMAVLVRRESKLNMGSKLPDVEKKASLPQPIKSPVVAPHQAIRAGDSGKKTEKPLVNQVQKKVLDKKAKTSSKTH